jgi:hypothetical protein
MTCSQRKGQQQSIYTTLYTIYYPLYQQKPEPVQQKKIEYASTTKKIEYIRF